MYEDFAALQHMIGGPVLTLVPGIGEEISDWISDFRFRTPDPVIINQQLSPTTSQSEIAAFR